MSTAPARRKQAAPPAQAQAPAARDIRDFLESQIERIAQACPEKVRPEQMIQVIATAIYRSETLQKCDRLSILTAVIQGAELGLSFAPSLGEAYLVPRYNSKAGCYECHFQPGYQGLIQLAYRSQFVAMIDARLVRERDEFVLEYDPGLVFRHRPALGRAGGEVVGVYAYAKLVNGEAKVEYLDADEVEAIHQRSESYRSAVRYGKPEQGPWVTDRGEMSRKTALRRIFKHIPRSKEIAVALDAHDADYQLDGPPPPAARRVVAGRGSAALAARLAGRALEAPGGPEPEFSAAEGVARPLRSEADEPAEVPADDEPPDPDYPDPEEAEIGRQAARDAGTPAGRAAR